MREVNKCSAPEVFAPNKGVGTETAGSGRKRRSYISFSREIFHSRLPARCDKINPQWGQFPTISRVSNIFQAFSASPRRIRALAATGFPVNFVERAVGARPRENAAHSGGVSFYLWRMERGWFSFHDSIFRDKAVVVSGHFGRVGTPPLGSTGGEETKKWNEMKGKRKKESGRAPYKNAISAGGTCANYSPSPTPIPSFPVPPWSPPWTARSSFTPRRPRQQLMAKLWSSQLLFNGTPVITASVAPGYRCSCIIQKRRV